MRGSSPSSTTRIASGYPTAGAPAVPAAQHVVLCLPFRCCSFACGHGERAALSVGRLLWLPPRLGRGSCMPARPSPAPACTARLRSRTRPVMTHDMIRYCRPGCPPGAGPPAAARPLNGDHQNSTARASVRGLRRRPACIYRARHAGRITRAALPLQRVPLIPLMLCCPTHIACSHCLLLHAHQARLPTPSVADRAPPPTRTQAQTQASHSARCLPLCAALP